MDLKYVTSRSVLPSCFSNPFISFFVILKLLQSMEKAYLIINQLNMCKIKAILFA